MNRASLRCVCDSEFLNFLAEREILKQMVITRAFNNFAGQQFEEKGFLLRNYLREDFKANGTFER